MIDNRYEALEFRIYSLEKKLNKILYNIDESCFSNEYIEKQKAVENGISELSHSLQKNNTVKKLDIEDASITNAKLAKAAVKNINIENASIDNSKLTKACVDSINIKEAAIESSHIKDLSIDRAHIKDAAISSSKIDKASIISAHIVDSAIDSTKIGKAAVSKVHIQDASIDSAKIENLAVKTANIALNAITRALIADEAVGSAQIADASITDAKVVELSANKITAGILEVARLIITGEASIVSKINEENKTSQRSLKTIDGAAITERSITADRIVAKSIGADEIKSKSIGANEIMSNSIKTNHIDSDTILARHIKSHEIDASKLTASCGRELNIESNEAIVSKVSKDELEDKISEYTSIEYNDKDIKSTIKQTKESILFEINKLSNTVHKGEDTLTKLRDMISVWQKFSDLGLMIGKSDSKFSILISNDRISFLENAREIAYFSNNEVSVLAANIDKEINFGDKEFKIVINDGKLNFMKGV